MTETPTKDSLAELIGELKSRSKPFDWPVLDALRDLALEALEMRPRPLAEIDKAETALVIERDQHSESLNVFVLNCYGSGLWKRSPASQAWLPSTLAIPLSAIPKEKP